MDNLYTIKICWEEEDRMKKCLWKNHGFQVKVTMREKGGR